MIFKNSINTGSTMSGSLVCSTIYICLAHLVLEDNLSTFGLALLQLVPISMDLFRQIFDAAVFPNF